MRVQCHGYLLTFPLRYPVAAVMCDVLRATNRQKVQRVILATFRVREVTSSTPARLSCQCPRTYCSLTVYTHLITCFCLCMLLFIYIYHSLVKECPPPVYFWFNFLCRVKVYLYEPWSELHIANEYIRGAHAQRQAPCISKV